MTENMSIVNFVGKRCLLQIREEGWKTPSVTEYKIIEISPSGNWVKLMNMNGLKFWRPVMNISLVEVLKEFEK